MATRSHITFESIAEFLHSHKQPAADTAPLRRTTRPKLFTEGPRVSLTRDQKAALVARAANIQRLKQESPKGLHITRAALDVLRALLYACDDIRRQSVSPTLKQIAERAACARSTVQLALKALADHGLLQWVNRLQRVRERFKNWAGTWKDRLRVFRTSNAYEFQCCKKATNTDFRSTRDNNIGKKLRAKLPVPPPGEYPPLLDALARLAAAHKKATKG